MKRIVLLFVFLFLCISEAALASIESYSGSDSCIAAPKKVLILSEIELQNLGIVSDSSGFVYVRIQGAKTWHTVVAYNAESRAVSFRNQYQGYNRKKATKVELLGIASCNAELVYATKRDKDHAYIDPTKAEECVAIKVPLGSVQHDYAIAWFQITDDLMDLLPEGASLALKKSKRAYDVSFEELDANWRMHFDRRNSGDSPQDSARDAYFKSLITDEDIFSGANIVAGSEYLNDLGISVKKDWFEVKQNDFVITKTEQGFRKSGGSINSYKQSISYDLKQMVPLFITVEGEMTRSLGNSAIGLGMDGGRMGYVYGEPWMKERQRLIGLHHHLNDTQRVIFWYAYSPVIKGLLSPLERKEVEGFIKFGFKLTGSSVSPNIFSLEQLRLPDSKLNPAYTLWSLNPEQMKQMGFAYDSLNHVLFPFKSPGGAPIWYSINYYEIGLSDKVESIPGMEIHANFMYTNLVCITDGRGLGPRMINAETGDGLNWDKLIPVRVSTGKTISLYEQGAGDWSHDVIFWFRTDSEVLKRFGEIKEYSYFPETAPKLVDFSNVDLVLKRNTQQDAFSPIYSFKLTWKSKEKLNCTLKIYNMEGLPIYSTNVSSKGKNKLKLPVELFPTGFYTVVVTSEAGDEIQFPIMMPYDVWR